MITDLRATVQAWRAKAKSPGNAGWESGLTLEECATELASLLPSGSAGEVEAALRRIVEEPHGCRFCDSGRLRNPMKGHDDDCGFAMAVRALGMS